MVRAGLWDIKNSSGDFNVKSSIRTAILWQHNYLSPPCQTRGNMTTIGGGDAGLSGAVRGAEMSVNFYHRGDEHLLR